MYRISQVRNSRIWQGFNTPAMFFIARMHIDADGDPRAYGPPGSGAPETSANAPADVLVSDPSAYDRLYHQGGVPGGFYVSKTSLEDHTKAVTDPQRYVDSSTIPYMVIPRRIPELAHLRLGDLGVVVNTISWSRCFAIFADIGPPSEIGEGSMALADAIHLSHDPQHGGIEERKIAYLVFPQSSTGWPRTLNDINGVTSRLYRDWGGLGRLRLAILLDAWSADLGI